MRSRHADSGHSPIFRPRGPGDPLGTSSRWVPQGSDDWILDRVAPGDVVLLVGTDAARFASQLSGRTGRVEVVGCEVSLAAALAPFCSQVTAADLDEFDLGRLTGGPRFDVVVATELLDSVNRPGGLLLAIRDLLAPGGCVIASQTFELRREFPGSPTSLDASPAPGDIPLNFDPGHAPGGSMLAFFEDAGFAVSEFRPMTLPGRIPEPKSVGHGTSDSSSSEEVARVERSLYVAHPIRNFGPRSDDAKFRAVIDEKEAACRKAAELARELRASFVQVASISGRLARSVEREEELHYQILQVHEQLCRGDEDLEAMAGRLIQARIRINDLQAAVDRFQEIIREVAAHRDDLEARLIGFRQSIPGRLFRITRALLSWGRR